MGKSSPTKLQLKHIPDQVVLETIYFISWQWQVWMGASGEPNGMRKMSFIRPTTARFSDISEALRPLPDKLILAKLRHLEKRGLIEGYGPSGMHFAVITK
jgi:hypothetical protein